MTLQLHTLVSLRTLLGLRWQRKVPLRILKTLVDSVEQVSGWGEGVLVGHGIHHPLVTLILLSIDNPSKILERSMMVWYLIPTTPELSAGQNWPQHLTRHLVTMSREGVVFRAPTASGTGTGSGYTPATLLPSHRLYGSPLLERSGGLHQFLLCPRGVVPYVLSPNVCLWYIKFYT